MSTSSHRRSGLRRPFGSINANTLSSSLSASSGKSAGENSTVVKKEKKKGLLSRTGLFGSMLPSGGKKKERTEEVSSESKSLESPAKKTRVENAQSFKPAAEAVLPRAHQGGLKSDESDTVTALFRRQTSAEVQEVMDRFWDDDMEDMLSLKIANPVLDDSRDEDDDSSNERESSDESRSEPEGNYSNNLAKDLDENSNGDSLMWSSRLPEHEAEGFKITFQN